MKQCWNEDPESRPDFQEIKILIEQLLREQFPLAYENMMELLNPSNYYVNFQNVGSTSLSPLPPMDNPNYLLTPTSNDKLLLNVTNHGYINQRTPLTTVEEDDDEVFFPQKEKQDKETIF